MASLRRKLFMSRRRVDDEGEEDGGPDATGQDDDSLSEVSALSDDADGSERSRQNSTSPELHRAETNGHAISSYKLTSADGVSSKEQVNNQDKTTTNGSTDTDMMLNGLKISEEHGIGDAVNYDDLQLDDITSTTADPTSTLKYTAQMDQAQEGPVDRRRREHEEYKKKRDADPAFVPNRGAFFMHDHRHAGPAANGFRPFGRGRGRGGRGGIGGPFAPVK
jgi:hypothetical protein